MGTNYYLQHGVCECCKKPDSTRHIGKSSGGWCFSLHVYPEEGINTLDDWKVLFRDPNSRIVDEYGQPEIMSSMLTIIENRNWKPRDDKPPYAMGIGDNTWEEFHRKNYSQDGPNNLFRHQILEGHCIGHGEGTWDYIIGEFS